MTTDTVAKSADEDDLARLVRLNELRDLFGRAVAMRLREVGIVTSPSVRVAVLLARLTCARYWSFVEGGAGPLQCAGLRRSARQALARLSLLGPGASDRLDADGRDVEIGHLLQRAEAARARDRRMKRARRGKRP